MSCSERTQLTEHIDELERAHAEQREAWEEQSALRLAEKDKVRNRCVWGGSTAHPYIGKISISVLPVSCMSTG